MKDLQEDTQDEADASAGMDDDDVSAPDDETSDLRAMWGIADDRMPNGAASSSAAAAGHGSSSISGSGAMSSTATLSYNDSLQHALQRKRAQALEDLKDKEILIMDDEFSGVTAQQVSYTQEPDCAGVPGQRFITSACAVDFLCLFVMTHVCGYMAMNACL